MIKFSLITPERTALSEEIYEAILPSANGQISILPNHMPLVTLIVPGVISLRRQKGDSDDRMEHLATSGGFAEISHNVLKVMATTAERADELDELKIEAARQEAQRMARQAKDDIAHSDAVAQLETEIARLRVKNMKKHHGRTINPENVQ